MYEESQILNKLILSSSNNATKDRLVWKSSSRTDSKVTFYTSKFELSNKRHVMFKFIKDNSKRYVRFTLDMYLSFPLKPKQKLILKESDYTYKHILQIKNNIFLTKLYAYIKFKNILNLELGKQKFYENLLYLTDHDYISWTKRGTEYQMDDVNSKFFRLYLVVNRYSKLSVMYENDDELFVIEYIFDVFGYNFYNMLEKKYN